MTITLTYAKDDGTQEQIEYEEGVTEINLSVMNLHAVDLTPLSTCTELKRLFLSDNQLRSINLTPLSSCTNLREFGVSDNQLQSIDLTPLSSCTSLQIIWLQANQFQSIDLNPLSNSAALRFLFLNDNHLQSIDLTPLSSCTNLERLDLSHNQLQNIGLKPLSSCTDLQILELSNNQLQSINLNPLNSCGKLRSLYLNDNRLQSIDLTPLSNSAALEYLSMDDNPLQVIDLTPLSSCATLSKLTLEKHQHAVSWLPVTSKDVSKSIEYQRPIPLTYPWSFLHRVIEEQGTDWRIQQDVLLAMNLGGFGFIDADLRELLLSFPRDASLVSVRDTVEHHLVEHVLRAKTTTGMNLEAVSGGHPLVALKVKEIIEARERELERFRYRELSDLMALCFTAYGFQVLSALGIRSHRSFMYTRRVRISLEHLGFELKRADEFIPGVEMSDKLKEAILWIVRNQGTTWNIIRTSNETSL